MGKKLKNFVGITMIKWYKSYISAIFVAIVILITFIWIKEEKIEDIKKMGVAKCQKHIRDFFAEGFPSEILTVTFPKGYKTFDFTKIKGKIVSFTVSQAIFSMFFIDNLDKSWSKRNVYVCYLEKDSKNNWLVKTFGFDDEWQDF